jgi:hypothetical protein
MGFGEAKTPSQLLTRRWFGGKSLLRRVCSVLADNFYRHQFLDVVIKDGWDGDAVLLCALKSEES